MMNIQTIRERWNLLLAIATAICTAVAGFLRLPEIGIDSVAWSKFGTFAVALLIGIWLVPMRIYSARRFLPMWVSCSVLLFGSSAVVFSHFTDAIDRWTFAYPSDDSSTRVVAGVTLSPESNQQRKDGESQGHNVPDRVLLDTAGGEIGDVWPIDRERTDRATPLRDMYLAELFLLASAVVTVVQASYCAGMKKAASRTP